MIGNLRSFVKELNKTDLVAFIAALFAGAAMSRYLSMGTANPYALVFLLLLFAYCWVERERLDDRRLLLCAALISVAVPFFLPHMHDRYFFPADVLSLALVFAVPQLLPIPVLVSFASLLGYHAYLLRRFLFPMSYGAAALLLVILALILTLALSGQRSGAHVRR